MTVSISYQQAVDLLELAVEERGKDFTYIRAGQTPDDKNSGYCAYYTENGSPSCIVGWVLNRLGITAWQCQQAGVNESSVDELVTNEIIKIDFKTYALLMTAQALQDAITPWGKTLEIAKGVAENIIAPPKSEDMHEYCLEESGWEYIAYDAAHYSGEPIDWFTVPGNSWILPIFEEIQSGEFVSDGVQTFEVTEFGTTKEITAEVFVEAI